MYVLNRDCDIVSAGAAHPACAHHRARGAEPNTSRDVSWVYLSIHPSIYRSIYHIDISS